jgi:hypothetical protein
LTSGTSARANRRTRGGLFVTAHARADNGPSADRICGGNVDFAVNGDFRNVAALSTLDGLVVGGATVTVAFVGGVGFETGTVEITAPHGVVIESFLVGGQEFFLDDVCHHW